MTHTFVELEVSQRAYAEIAEKFRVAGYDHAFLRIGDQTVIDMHGIGIRPSANAADAPPSDHIVDVNKMIWPESLTPELAEALGVMNFNTGPLAHLFRAAGHDIPGRCEPEQAFVLHWMAGLVLKHGAEWRQHVRAKIEELRATIAKGIDP